MTGKFVAATDIVSDRLEWVSLRGSADLPALDHKTSRRCSLRLRQALATISTNIHVRKRCCTYCPALSNSGWRARSARCYRPMRCSSAVARIVQHGDGGDEVSGRALSVGWGRRLRIRRSLGAASMEQASRLVHGPAAIAFLSDSASGLSGRRLRDNRPVEIVAHSCRKATIGSIVAAR
jgi:hypothetical protein